MEPIPFKRTVCACQSCQDCCRRVPGVCLPGEPERIAAKVGKPVEALFVASPGALVKNVKTNLAYWIKAIRPRKVKGKCIFLTEAGLCSIHEISPFGCSHFDTHMSAHEANKRSVWGHKLIQDNPEYYKLREKLPIA